MKDELPLNKPPENLALTYNNDRKQDGAGAQLQRIYGIYALSRLLGVSYFHSPIKRIGYQGLLALENNQEDARITHEFNEKFKILSDMFLSEPFHNIDMDDV